MYSRAKILDHPIHPALVAFPVAFYVATLICLIVFAAGSRDPFWFHAAAWTGLTGVVMAAVAAVPGLVDALSIPRRTRIRQTAIAHGALNVVTLVLFLIATISMWRDWLAKLTPTLDAALPLVLSAVGTATLLTAGALGWTLVQTYHVGISEPQATGASPPSPTAPGMGELRPPPSRPGVHPGRP
jgi:uncharacterized membrane protein